MDHAASLLAQAGHALRIDFFPLRVQPVPLPAGIAVVVCHSLVRAEKSAGARDAYNTRVIECRLACRVMERALKDSLPRGLARLGDLSEIFPGRPLADFFGALADTLPDGPLRLAEVAKAAGLSPAQLERACEIPKGMPDRFSILPRARHVLSEADRVTRAVAALTAAEVEELGALMAASHRSCRDDYQVSCRELDDLVEVAVRAGALGARLTGAGFGGCTVNLVRVAEVEPFLAAVDRDFYRSWLDANDEPSRHRFVFTPCQGAMVTWR
jgi:N-acetylgalactosamine kinase